MILFIFLLLLLSSILFYAMSTQPRLLTEYVLSEISMKTFECAVGFWLGYAAYTLLTI